ncbi:MAG: four helix bundle protein [Candidatus Moraniibacteriota bacterium]
MKSENFHDILKKKADRFAFYTYKISKNFPKEEIYGITSQLRRSSLSVILNYIEGYARKGDKEYKYFLKISYGSLKESKYLIFFAYREKYISKEDYNKLISLADELGAMFWSIIQKIDKK